MTYVMTDLVENYLRNPLIIQTGIKYCKNSNRCIDCPLCDQVCIDYTGEITGLYDSTTLNDLNKLIEALRVFNMRCISR